jgi:hypothetical protein
MSPFGQVAATAGALLALLVAAPSALAQSQLYNDFQADGQINPCAYSPGQLQEGLNSLPPDLQQYAPGFADQLRGGLEAQCGGGAAPAPGEDLTTPGLAGSGPSKNTRVNTPAAPRPAKRQLLGDLAAPSVGATPAGSDAPGWLLPALVLAGALAALFGAAASGLIGFGPERFTQPMGASLSDAGGRTADALAYARDVFRFGP